MKDTSIEVALQNELKKRGIAFEPHYLIKGQPDIFIEPNICIFADGDYWHNYPDGREVDKEITKFLENRGYVVYRFWGNEIRKSASACIDKVQELG